MNATLTPVAQQIQNRIAEREAEIRSLNEVRDLLAQRDQLMNDITAAEARVATLNQAKNKADALLTDMKRLVAIAVAERDRIRADAPAEILAMKNAIAAAAAVADEHGALRCRFLAARKWTMGAFGWISTAKVTKQAGQAAMQELQESLKKLNLNIVETDADITAQQIEIERVPVTA